MEHPLCSVCRKSLFRNIRRFALKNFSSKMLQNMLFFMCNNNKLCTSKLAEHLTKPNSEFRQIPNNFKLFKMKKGASLHFFLFLRKWRINKITLFQLIYRFFGLFHIGRWLLSLREPFDKVDEKMCENNKGVVVSVNPGDKSEK